MKIIDMAIAAGVAGTGLRPLTPQERAATNTLANRLQQGRIDTTSSESPKTTILEALHMLEFYTCPNCHDEDSSKQRALFKKIRADLDRLKG